VNAWNSVGKNAGKWESSPARRNWRGWLDSVGRRAVDRGGSSCALRAGAGAREERNGSSRAGSARACPNEQGAGEEVGKWGAGARLRPVAASYARERGWLGKEKKLTGGPCPAATEERGGVGGAAGWSGTSGPAQ
jgi:hypothetical protein